MLAWAIGAIKQQASKLELSNRFISPSLEIQNHCFPEAINFSLLIVGVKINVEGKVATVIGGITLAKGICYQLT
ncbi:hypothetical protein GCM10011533_32510 [Streptosporangium jomthongense]|nr:hypothetical protein GCM10011533_32510 [Streptosporangium jomthongense]